MGDEGWSFGPLFRLPVSPSGQRQQTPSYLSAAGVRAGDMSWVGDRGGVRVAVMRPASAYLQSRPNQTSRSERVTGAANSNGG
jgi:hypothetical protein